MVGAQGALMSAHVLSLPAVMTIFTKFHLWPPSSHGVNAGQPNEEILCLELHSPALVQGRLPMATLAPEPFAV